MLSKQSQESQIGIAGELNFKQETIASEDVDGIHAHNNPGELGEEDIPKNKHLNNEPINSAIDM